VIEKSINFINARYADPALDNQAIGEHVGVSTNHLSFLFKEQLNITVHKYLTHVRIEQAKSLIVEGEKTLTVIAEESASPASIRSAVRQGVGRPVAEPVLRRAFHIRKIDKERDQP